MELEGGGRPYLLYCPIYRGACMAELFEGHRLYDVAVNDYSGEPGTEPRAEHAFAEPRHKWPAIAVNLPRLGRSYRFYGFIDDDIEASTTLLNRLFLAGEALALDLYQPALTPESFASHASVRQEARSLARRDDFVEIMNPFFSHRALVAFRDLFGQTESGWGLDVVWSLAAPKLGLSMGTVDACAVAHRRPLSSEGWRLSNGLTPREEMHAFLRMHAP